LHRHLPLGADPERPPRAHKRVVHLELNNFNLLYKL
jgi:hypothetical protein